MIILGVDLGHARTGLSVCDKTELLASPAGVIKERNDTALVEKIVLEANERSAQKIIVGLPRNMDGTCGFAAQRAQELAKQIEEKSGVEVVLWDERCTTQIAQLYLNDTDTRGKKRKAAVDTVAATIILQSYLDSKKQ